jgi:hypothetical protein
MERVPNFTPKLGRVVELGEQHGRSATFISAKVCNVHADCGQERWSTGLFGTLAPDLFVVTVLIHSFATIRIPSLSILMALLPLFAVNQKV